MKALILAGGLGTRLREETEFRPKPMVEIGGRPILWHIMKHLSGYGITEFVIAVGYRGEMIKDYFLNYETRNNDFTVRLGNKHSVTIHGGHDEADWQVTIVDTGAETLTGGRVKRAARYLDDEAFLVTYGDGLSDVNIDELVATHMQGRTLATLTITQPTSRFGVADITESGLVSQFLEKPKLEGWVNIGYFIFETSVLDYLDDDGPLETTPLSRLSAEGHLGAYRHSGYWQPMDTYREAQMLNQAWNEGNAPWSNSRTSDSHN
jgi:glucose-1-phosphate cytidylyltransferase